MECTFKEVVVFPLSVCLSGYPQDYAKSFRFIFMKHCVIMDCCCVMNPVNIGVELIRLKMAD